MSSRAAIAAVAVAAASLLVVAPVPSYDPWAWLLWGREVAHLQLSTADGPAFKPLPVAVCALLAPLGSTAAPVAWVLVARCGAALATVLAYRLGRDLAGGSRAAGWLAAVGVAAAGGWLAYAASGSSEGLLVALALGAVVAIRAGRPGPALACVAGCALLRVEAWPFAAAYAIWRWRRAGPRERTALAASAAAIPALWLVPELLGSGDLLRSGDRARVPNPGQPALADVPAWASLRAAVALLPWPLWLAAAAAAVLAARRRLPAPIALLAAGGAAWIALVAAMAQAGFSGEPRYALPGVALLAVAAAAAAGRTPRATLVAVAALVALAAAPRLAEIGDVTSTQRHQAALVDGLRAAIANQGGPDALLRHGRPVVGPLRGPMLAYALGVEKRQVGFVPAEAGAGVVFASRRTPASPVEPVALGDYRQIARTDTWTLLIRSPEYTAAPCAASNPPSPPSCSPSPPSSSAAAPTRMRATTSSRSSPPPRPAARTTSTSSSSPTA